MMVYGALLMVLIGALVSSMALRTTIILDVIRDRNSLYRELPGDLIENIYTIKVINQSNDARVFKLSVKGVQGIHLDGEYYEVAVDGGGVLSLPVRVRVQRANARGIMNVDFIAEAMDDSGDMRAEDSRFVGPSP